MRTLAAVLAVLSRWSRHDEVGVGLQLPPRSADLGDRGRTAVLRVAVADDPPFASFVARVRAGLRDAPTGWDLDELIEMLGDIDRGWPGLPTRVRIGARPAPPPVRVGELRCTLLTVPHAPAAAELLIDVTGDSVVCGYDGGLFTGETIETFLGHVEHLLATAGDGAVPLSAMPLSSAGPEVAHAEAATAGPRDTGRLHHQVWAQAARTPDATAAVCGGRRLTYRELERDAGRLAYRLRDLGVGPEEPVGVCLDRSVDLVTAMLGVLSAGGAFVPLDPAQSAERISATLDGCGATVVVTAQRCWPAAPTNDRIQLVHLPLAGAPSGLPNRPPDIARAANLAYIIHTSGTTSAPKGVQVEHGQITGSAAARSQVYPQPFAAYLPLASPWFDPFCAAVAATLRQGGTLVLPTDEEALDPFALADLIRRERVSHLDGVPGQYAALLEADPVVAAGLRCVVVGGEACPAALVERHGAVAPDTVLVNEYGPTETTVWATAYRAWPGWQVRGSVPIGGPAPGYRAYVLDDRLRAAPAGVPGELCVAGVGVARGYAHQPALTAERFRPDPHGPPGARMYCTGDLVRRLPNGDLEFLGRIDEQVKVRGFRVEPAEVAAIVQAFPGVVEAVVAARPAPSGGHARLVAYVVAGQTPPTPADLTAFTAARLPGHQVPAAWVYLDALPRTGTGKVDRAALPVPLAPRPDRPPVDRATYTPMQRRVATIFADLGDHAASGLDDPVMAWSGGVWGPAALAARLWDEFGVRLADLDAPLTVRRVAAIVARASCRSPTRDNADG